MVNRNAFNIAASSDDRKSAGALVQMWNQRCDGLETQPRTVRKLAEASVRCQATGSRARSPRVNTGLGVSTLMMRLDDLTRRRRLRMEKGGSARWDYFWPFAKNRARH